MRAKRLQRINQKGWDVAQLLIAVKARANLELADIQGLTADDTQDPPEVRLRRYLDQINQARSRLDTSDYGQCQACSATLSEGQLDEMPWVELCQPCATNSQ